VLICFEFAEKQLKRRKVLNVFDPDEATMNYFENLPPVLPATVDELKNYLRLGESAQHPFSCSRQLSEIFHWENNFVEKACITGQSNAMPCCDSLEEVLSYFAVTPNSLLNDSEQTMTPIVDASLQLLVLFCQVQRARNVAHHTTSARKKPDYFIAKHHTVVVRGEEKLQSNYQPGIYGHDPVVENVEKTPWGRWAEFYGEAPYILSFSCIGDSSHVNMTMGVLVAMSESFVPLFTYNIASSFDRPKFALEVLKLLPVLKGIISAVSVANIPSLNSGVTMERCQIELGMTKEISVLVHEGEPIVEMRWSLRNSAQMYAMLTRMVAVFGRIDTLPCDVGCMRLVRPLGLHKTDDDIKMEFKGFFSPYGQQLRLATVKEVVCAVASVATCLEQLHGVGVVHNDIRWDNVVQLTNEDASVKYIVIDFDDSYVVQESAPRCPALTHLNRDGHCPLTFEPHGAEVDVWALGYLLQSNRLTAHDPAIRSIADDILKNYLTLSISEIQNMLTDVLQ